MPFALIACELTRASARLDGGAVILTDEPPRDSGARIASLKPIRECLAVVLSDMNVTNGQQAGMQDDSALHERVRAAIAAGDLPNQSPDRSWGGPATGVRCALCAAVTRTGEYELELEFGYNGGRKTYYVHPDCFRVFERARHGLSNRAIFTRAPAGGAGQTAADAGVE
jgi:hypothetical protein